MISRYMPWLDRSGRLSWLKLVTFLLLFAPGLWIALQWKAGWLQPKPVTEAIHQTGTWAVRFLLLSLAVTPLRRLGQWNKLIAVRRMLGLAVLAYGLVHLTLYVVDQQFDLVHVASEIALRFYLTIGFVALLGFVVLGATSTDGMIRRLGPHRWNRLHQIVYGLGVLALLHFFLQAKLVITQPVLMAGFFLILIGYRVLARLRRADDVLALLGLAVLAGIGTAFIEAGWYQFINHVPASRVLPANLDFSGDIRPAWWVFAVGIGIVAIRLSRRLWAKRASTPRTGRSPARQAPV
jgi:sulfoxide reductase heme-binding subunit YedZ